MCAATDSAPLSATPSSPLRLVFMGTPEFSVPCLEHLLQAKGEVELLGVLTQPDKPAGRGKKLTPPPVKVLAEQHGLPVFQPLRLRKDAALLDWLAQIKADYFVTIAFGQILSQPVLDAPRLGTVNVHASLLPALRGPNPIQQAILLGHEETGLTTMLTELGVDTGPMLKVAKTPILAEDTLSTLSERLSAMAGPLLLETLLQHAQGQLSPHPQDETLATHAPKLEKEAASLRMDQPALTLWRQVRAQNPWPGATVMFEGQPMKLHQVRPATAEDMARFPDGRAAEPGTIVGQLRQGLLIATGDGLLLVEQLQPAGKKVMPAADWARNALPKGTGRFEPWQPKALA